MRPVDGHGMVSMQALKYSVQAQAERGIPYIRISSAGNLAKEEGFLLGAIPIGDDA